MKFWKDGEKGGLSWRSITRAVLLGVVFTILVILSLIVKFGPGEKVALKEGDVSPYDIRAPRQVTYISQVLTEEARKRAAAAVEDVYDPPETRVARQQLNRARAILDFIDAVRNDPYPSLEDKKRWLEAIPDIPLSPEAMSIILTLEEEKWQEAAEEVISVLEKVMRTEIRESQLPEVRRRIPAMVGWQLDDNQTQVVVELVSALVRPNSFYNPQKTEEARQAARESVKPVSRTLEKGEIIIRGGDVVGPLELEALEVLGLKKKEGDWRDVLGPAIFALVISISLSAYILRSGPSLLSSSEKVYLLFALLTIFLLGTRLMVPGHVVLPYLLPLAGLSMLLSTFLNPGIALVATVFMSLLAGYMAGGMLELTVYYLAGGLVAPLVLGRAEKINSFLWAGIYIALMNASVILAFRLPQGNYDLIGLVTLMGASFLNGAISSSLTLGGFFLLGSLFGVITPLHLIELSRPTHPLLQQLLLKAPGTYHHSLLVGNMAEQAAERIGANALLARVGAYYHDIGKILRPYFFVENQMDGVNVHERLDPRTSAQIIISHVKDGLDLARKYHLPPQIQDFITQHQGRGLVGYFYQQACEEAGGPEQVDEAAFHYPGPRPQSKETAIVMLADACEATVRAAHPSTPEEIDEIVRKVIKEKLEAGELDESDLTLRDLEEIRKTFVAILQGVFHPRVSYPEEKKETPDEGKDKSRGESDTAVSAAKATGKTGSGRRFRFTGRGKKKR